VFYSGRLGFRIRVAAFVGSLDRRGGGERERERAGEGRTRGDKKAKNIFRRWEMVTKCGVCLESRRERSGPAPPVGSPSGSGARRYPIPIQSLSGRPVYGVHAPLRGLLDSLVVSTRSQRREWDGAGAVEVFERF